VIAKRSAALDIALADSLGRGGSRRRWPGPVFGEIPAGTSEESFNVPGG
jgi:hypothetical protein